LITSKVLAQTAGAAVGLPLKDLFLAIDPSEGLILLPKDSKFADYQISFNKRTQQQPEVRVLCKSAKAIAECIRWCLMNKVPFAIRGSGHSYEGYSQSTGLVIDTRLLKKLEIDQSSKIVTAEAGLSLGEIYTALASTQLAIAGGSCPTVGITGHLMGGGYGMIARAKGLACDNLISLQIVTADGKLLTASETENPDLFWACRGGGNGQLGVVTSLKIQAHTIPNVITFGISWLLTNEKALQLARAWQDWAPNCPEEITSLFKLAKDKSGQIAIRCAGQSIGSMENLKTELQNLLRIAAPSAELKAAPMTFMQGVQHFSGGFDYPSVYMKAKSDYLFQPMTDAGLNTLMGGLQKLPSNAIAVMMDSYGGAINKVLPTDTAFAHRNNTQYSIQYYSEWNDPASSVTRVGYLQSLYQSMRPFVSGHSYVNYCDMDLKDYETAYWGENLDRLRRVKATYDPQNIFNHKQSIRPKI
jgi:FAD/FMN-containing dehydrogenase